MLKLFTNNKQQQNRKLFEEAVDDYSEPLYWHARRMVVRHEDAEDVVQNTFANAWAHIEELRDITSLKSWLYSIATRESLAIIRTKSRMQPDEQTVTNILCQRLDDSVGENGDSIEAALQREILKLTESQRTVFLLRYYDELSYKEISNIIGITESTAKVHYHNAFNKITESLKNR